MKRASTHTTHTRQSNGPALTPDGTRRAVRRRVRPPRIVLVVSCAHRKRLAPSDELRLSSVAHPPAERSAEWRRRLRTVDAPTLPTRDLYAGEHWRVACNAYELTLKFSSRAELWIISAGQGLVASHERIKSYSATFSSGFPDSVWRGSADGDRRQCLREWLAS